MSPISDSPRVSAASSAFIEIPTELRSRITAFLPKGSADNLALTCSSLVDVAESVAWSSLTMRLPITQKPKKSIASIRAADDAVTTLWKRCERALLARPVRLTFVLRLDYELSPAAVPIAARYFVASPVYGACTSSTVVRIRISQGNPMPFSDISASSRRRDFAC